MSYFKYSLPWPPTVNHYYRRAEAGQVKINDKVREFREVAGLQILAGGRPRAPLGGPVEIIITLVRPDDRRFDIDNRAKAILDALQFAHVLADDSWVVVPSLSIVVADQRTAGGMALVEITEL